MRIALDGSPCNSPTGGIRRYTIELARALARTFPEDRYWLVSDKQIHLNERLPDNLRFHSPERERPRLWWTWRLGRECNRLGAEVFHGTNFEVPYLTGGASVVTIHDISAWKNLDWGASARVRRRTPVLLGLRLPAMVITPSEAARRDVIAQFGLHPGRVVAVPLGVRAQFRAVEAPPKGEPYFLHAGTIEPRKNVPRIIEAWRAVRERHPVRLVLAGRLRGDSPAIAAEPGLEIVGEVSDNELPALYSGALAVLCPSFYEGFGLPVLEAMACGAPVITSRDPALCELAGDAGTAVDAADNRGWVEAMTIAVTNGGWRARSREASLARAAGFSWEKTASATREVYQEAQRRFG